MAAPCWACVRSRSRRIASVRRFYLCCPLSGLRFAAAFFLPAGLPTPNPLYHLIDRDVFKFALPDNPSATANRSPYPWIRRTEQRNRWTAEIGGQVRDAGVVADIGTAAAEMVEDFRKAQILEHRAARQPQG